MRAVWDAETVQAVMRHMNEDHAQDCLLLVRRLGNRPDATDARLTGMDRAGLLFAVTQDEQAIQVRVGWLVEPLDRADIRTQVVALHAQASGGEPG